MLRGNVSQKRQTGPQQLHVAVQARFELAPCALVAPHVHPRGTELLFVYEGAVTLGWSEENGGRVLENNITAGSSGFVPQGLINWVQARFHACSVRFVIWL